MLDRSMMPREPLSRAEYDRMVAQGCFEDERIELLEGALVKMSPQGPRHLAITRMLTELFVLAICKRAQVQIQGPLALSDDSEPEPDVALIPRGYRKELPSEAYLVVEVAESSVRRDRELKSRLYARAGIPEYWLVNVPDQTVEVYRAARDGAYREIAVCRSGDFISVTKFPDIRIAVDELFAVDELIA